MKQTIIFMCAISLSVVFFAGCAPSVPTDQASVDQTTEVTHTTMDTESTGSVTEDLAAFESELDSLDAAADFTDFSTADLTE